MDREDVIDRWYASAISGPYRPWKTGKEKKQCSWLVAVKQKTAPIFNKLTGRDKRSTKSTQLTNSPKSLATSGIVSPLGSVINGPAALHLEWRERGDTSTDESGPRGHNLNDLTLSVIDNFEERPDAPTTRILSQPPPYPGIIHPDSCNRGPIPSLPLDDRDPRSPLHKFESLEVLEVAFNENDDPEQVMSSPSRIPRPVGAPLMVIMAQRNRSNHEFSALNTAEGTNASPVPRVIQPTQLPPISERNSTETDHEIAIPLSSEVPTLHIASSAERIIMGDEASSIPLLSRQHEFRSQGVFYPRTMQNTSPVSDVSASTVRGEETTTSPRRRVHAHLPPERRPSPTKSIHTSPRSSTDNSSPGCSNCESPHARSIPAVRRTTVDNAMSGSAKTLPPRTSSLNVFSHSAHKPLRPSKSFQNPHANAMMGQSQTMNFLDICRSHPELEGTVIQTNIVKAPEPRMTRVMGNLRHAFTRGRTDKRSVSSMFEIVNQRPPIPRPVVPPPPVAASETKSSLTTTAGSDACPSNRSGQIRQVETPGVDSVCRTLNAVGLRLVEDDDIERRRLWYREFVQLFNLLADFNSRDTRIGEAASHVSQMRAEASLRRYAMLLQVHQVIHDHDDLEALIESADFPTDRIVEEWHS